MNLQERCEEYSLQRCIRGGPGVFAEYVSTQEQQTIREWFSPFLDSLVQRSDVWAIFLDTLPPFLDDLLFSFVAARLEWRFILTGLRKEHMGELIPSHLSVPNLSIDIHLGRLRPSIPFLVDYQLVIDSDPVIYSFNGIVNEWCQGALSALISFESSRSIAAYPSWNNPSSIQFHHMDESQMYQFLSEVRLTNPVKVVHMYPNVHIEEEFGLLMVSLPALPAFASLGHLTIGCALDASDWKCLLSHVAIPSIQVCYHNDPSIFSFLSIWTREIIPFLQEVLDRGAIMGVSMWKRLQLDFSACSFDSLHGFNVVRYFGVFGMPLLEYFKVLWMVDLLEIKFPSTLPNIPRLPSVARFEETGLIKLQYQVGGNVQVHERSEDEAVLQKQRLSRGSWWMDLHTMMLETTSLPTTLVQSVMDFV
jgi:hypothetical protein